ncbi:hypothetical protein THF1C08_60053 [Vibrio jasicida]|nr:hypothetical protein THF1C08_60053 [Vibrio jasicida]
MVRLPKTLSLTCFIGRFLVKVVDQYSVKEDVNVQKDVQ